MEPLSIGYVAEVRGMCCHTAEIQRMAACRSSRSRKTRQPGRMTCRSRLMFAAWSCSGVRTDCRIGLCQGKGGVYLAGGPDVREEDVPLVARREGEARLELRLDLFPARA